jgi:hypothetical protein
MRQCPFTGCLNSIDDAPATVFCPQHGPALSTPQQNRLRCALADHQAGRLSLRELRRLQAEVVREACGRKGRKK